MTASPQQQQQQQEQQQQQQDTVFLESAFIQQHP